MSAIRGRAIRFSRVVIFSNETKGYNQFLRWLKSVIATGPGLVFSMEATGVYYENMAHHLHKINQAVKVVLSNTSKHYFSSLNIRLKQTLRMPGY